MLCVFPNDCKPHETGNMSVYQVCLPARVVINEIVSLFKNKTHNKWQLFAEEKGFCFLTFTVLFCFIWGVTSF